MSYSNWNLEWLLLRIIKNCASYYSTCRPAYLKGYLVQFGLNILHQCNMTVLRVTLMKTTMSHIHLFTNVMDTVT